MKKIFFCSPPGRRQHGKCRSRTGDVCADAHNGRDNVLPSRSRTVTGDYEEGCVRVCVCGGTPVGTNINIIGFRRAFVCGDAPVPSLQKVSRPPVFGTFFSLSLLLAYAPIVRRVQWPRGTNRVWYRDPGPKNVPRRPNSGLHRIPFFVIRM